MALVPQDIAPVVTHKGFYQYWLKLVRAGNTHQVAYEMTENLHDHILGWRMHKDFKIFTRKAERYKATARRKEVPSH